MNADALCGHSGTVLKVACSTAQMATQNTWSTLGVQRLAATIKNRVHPATHTF
jgi:hypothetical protein